MTKPCAKNAGASARRRLFNKARKTGRLFSEVLQYFAMERFLYRLSKSEYADKFVLKGPVVDCVECTIAPTDDGYRSYW